MSTTFDEDVAARGRWVDRWDPEDERFWAARGRRLARRNLLASAFAEHIAFSVWSMWSVLVLFMTPGAGFHITDGQRFLLISVPTAVGGALRLPYSRAVLRFGGRNWTMFSCGILAVPAALAVFLLQHPETPYWAWLLVAALTGLGGGNFASALTNVNTLYPQHRKGFALGFTAGGGNSGAGAVQLVGLLVIGAAGPGSASLIPALYLPLIGIAVVNSALRMDNFGHARSNDRVFREACAVPQTWLISVLYLSTFGSFIGYSTAFGLVLQKEFGFSAIQAVSCTFVGPLLGSLVRPLGGRLADRWGAVRSTAWSFLSMAAGAGLLVIASGARSLGLFVTAFTVMFVCSGVGNGAVYKLIPVVFEQRARAEVARGGDEVRAFVRARRLSGGAIAISGAIGAFGGLFINLGFGDAYARQGSGQSAFFAFLACYAVCVLLTWGFAARSGGSSTTDSR